MALGDRLSRCSPQAPQGASDGDGLAVGDGGKGVAPPPLDARPATALLVVDLQNAVVADAHERDTVLSRVSGLVDRARSEDVQVAWVQHDDEHIEKGSE